MYKQEGYNIVGAAIEVYNTLGHGSLEEVYQECLEIELKLRDVPFQSHPKLILSYKSKQLEKYYIPDLYVYDGIVVELKAVDLTPNYVPTLIRELSTFFILQSGRRSVAEPGGLQLAAKAAGVI